MARISRDTFDVDKNRDKVIVQTGVPWVDADANEQDDIQRERLRQIVQHALGDCALGDTFKVVQSSTDTSNNFKITSGEGFLLKGYQINLPSDVEYKNQLISDLCSITGLDADEVTCSHKNWVVDELIGCAVKFTSGVLNGNSYDITDNTANMITLDTDVEAIGALVYDRFEITIEALTTPGGARTDEVYIEMWAEEISGRDDTTIVEPTIGLILNDSLCRRMKVQAVVRVAENATTPSDTADHFYVKIAMLARTATANILTAMITDDRITLTSKLIDLAYTGHMWPPVQAAADLPAAANDKDLIFVEDDQALYWWNAEGVDQGAPYHKWYMVMSVSAAWHDSLHIAAYNDALAITADVHGNTIISDHMDDAAIHFTDGSISRTLQQVLDAGKTASVAGETAITRTNAGVALSALNNNAASTGISGSAAGAGSLGVRGYSGNATGYGVKGDNSVGVGILADGNTYDIELVHGKITSSGAEVRPSFKGSDLALSFDLPHNLPYHGDVDSGLAPADDDLLYYDIGDGEWKSIDFATYAAGQGLMRLLGYDYDATQYFGGAGSYNMVITTCSVTVPANAAPNGVMIESQAELVGASLGPSIVVIDIDGTKYNMGHNEGDTMLASSFLPFDLGDGWTPAVQHVLTIYFSGYSNTGSYGAHFRLVVKSL